MVDIKVNGPIEKASDYQKSSKTSSGGASAASFGGAVKTARRNLLDGELKENLSQVKAFGERFFRSPDEKTLETYKNAISEYLGKIKKELFSLKNEPGDIKDGQQKIFQLVETLDNELDELTKETFLKDKAVTLLAGLDDIRGLTLDLIT
ncbi:MAG: YaaR family protein [Candidatus Riflebacteria bacterium]|nr:YaaR family protein [Candidatus Riflebacteria bacterium]